MIDWQSMADDARPEVTPLRRDAEKAKPTNPRPRRPTESRDASLGVVGHVVVDGLRIAFRRTGSGPPVLLLHGALSDSRDWRRQLDAFAAEFTVIAWDAPGCGESDDLPSPDYGLDDLIDTLAGFIRALRLGRPHVLGLSLGSILAIALYGRYPMSARSLILASAYAGWAGSLPPAEVQRRIRLNLADLNRPADEGRPGIRRDPVAAHGPAMGGRRTNRDDHPGPTHHHESHPHPHRHRRPAPLAVQHRRADIAAVRGCRRPRTHAGRGRLARPNPGLAARATTWCRTLRARPSPRELEPRRPRLPPRPLLTPVGASIVNCRPRCHGP